MIRWVFMDVGNVLMNDDPVMAFLYDELYTAVVRAGHSMSFEDLLAEREELIMAEGPGHWAVLGERHLGRQGLRDLSAHCTATLRKRFQELRTEMTGIGEALRDLHEDYRLGIVANQLRNVLDSLEAFSWGELIEVRAVSEVIGLEKPAPGIFRWALDKAGCRAEEAVMVGDRVDNDIAPANKLGMWTIWLHIPHDGRGSQPRKRRARLYMESQLRVSVTTLRPRRDEETPDAEVSHLSEMVKAVRELDARSRAADGGKG